MRELYMLTFKNSLSAQISQYQLVAKSISTGFFQRNRFYLLKKLPEKFRNRVILFPEIASYFERFDVFSQLEPMEAINKLPKEIISEIETTYKSHWNAIDAYIKETSTKIARIENEINDSLKNILDIDPKIPIEISPKVFGSKCSYYSKSLKEFKAIQIFPRLDASIYSIFQTILTFSVHINNPDGFQMEDNKVFLDRQKALEDLISKFEVSQPEIGFTSMLNILQSKFVAKYAIESAEYYAKLGYPIEPYIKSANQIPGLTHTEKRILEKLIANRCKIVSFEDIAEIMWDTQSTEKYSLYAITKIVDRIKKKIFDTGIHTALIHTQRGEGYLLYD